MTTPRATARVVAAAALVALAAGAPCRAGEAGGPASGGAEPDWFAAGRAAYLQYCASCHGPGARGDGPVADVLDTPPPDLTRLALRYGQPLPLERLASTIDGRDEVRAHGTRQMPVWGEKLYAGPAPPSEAREKARRGTIELILLFLQSIQAPVDPEVPR